MHERGLSVMLSIKEKSEFAFDAFSLLSNLLEIDFISSLSVSSLCSFSFSDQKKPAKISVIRGFLMGRIIFI